MRSPRSWLLLLVGLLAAANLGTTFHRSGIPVAMTGLVERVEVRPEKHSGRDDVHMVTIAGRETHLDAEVASRVAEGDEVRKPAWSATLETSRGAHRLRLSTDFRGMALAMPCLLALALLLLRRGDRR